jgi:hypothetical protein
MVRKRRIRKLSTFEIIPLLESQRKLFSETKDDLLDSQTEQLAQCLELWLVPDSESRQASRKKARTFLAYLFNDKALGADVFLLCGLGISVTKLGTVNSTEAVYEIRKWWRQVEHPLGLTETAKEYIREHHSVFSILERQAGMVQESNRTVLTHDQVKAIPTSADPGTGTDHPRVRIEKGH